MFDQINICCHLATIAYTIDTLDERRPGRMSDISASGKI